MRPSPRSGRPAALVNRFPRGNFYPVRHAPIPGGEDISTGRQERLHADRSDCVIKEVRRGWKEGRAWPRIIAAGIAAATVAAAVWWFGWGAEAERARKVEAYIGEASRRYGVDPALVRAVVWRESRFRPEVRGRAGELGLMQVGALAAEDWAKAEGLEGFEHRELEDPRRNVLAGTWYLGHLLRRYEGTDQPEVFALADYNAGRSNVRRWIAGEARTNGAAFLRSMDFPGTRRYVESVLARREKYLGTAGKKSR